MKRGQHILVAVTGGIAAYKTAALVSRLVQSDRDVTVLMTEAATRFVGPLTFQSLSGRPVYTSQWEADEHHESPHIGLARSAELMVIAPASMNTIGKLANGLTDNIVTTVAAALPRQTPVLLAPAMNAEMWANPVTQRNLQTVREVLGYRTVGPGDGWQSCRTSGAGRMSEPDEIFEVIEQVLNESSG